MVQIIKLPFLKKKKIIRLILVVSLIAIHLFFLANLRFTAWPEMLSYPYLINRGYSFYGDIIHPFVPLLVVMLSFLYRFFGATPTVIYLSTIFLVLFTDILFYLIAKKLVGTIRAIIALFIYILFQLSFEGNGLWFDLALTPFFIVAFYSSYQWFKKKNYFYATLTGILLALAVLIKLSAFWLIGVIGVIGMIRDKKGLLIFLSSLVLTSATVLAVLFNLANLGKMSEFLYWGLTYPLLIITSMPGYIQPPSWKQMVVISGIFLPVMVGIVREFREVRKISDIGELWRKKLVFFLAVVFFFAASLFALHRFAYFHWQPALPFLAFYYSMLLGFYNLSNKIISRKISTAAVFVSIIILLLLFGRVIKRDWQKPMRFIEPQVVSVSRELARKLPSSQPIYFYNLPSQYFVLADLLPTKPWVDTFPWYLELPNIQERVIAQLDKGKTEWVVFSTFKEGGVTDLGSYKPVLIDDYVWRNFEISQRVEPDILLLRRK